MAISSASHSSQITSRLFFYAVAGGLGLAFTLTLFLYAWQNAIDAEERAFTFESAAVVNTLSRKVRASDDVIHNVSAIYQAMGEVSADAFQRFAGSVIAQHDFIDSVSYHSLVEGDATTDRDTGLNRRLTLRYQAVGVGRVALPVGFDLFQQAAYENPLRNALDSELTVPTPPNGDNDGSRTFLLLQAVRATPDVTVSGFVALKVDAARLVRDVSRPGLAIALLTVSPGVGGRETLFETQTASDADGWTAQAFNEDASIQFPQYSVKIQINKSIHLSDLDQGLVFTSLVLGLGTTLLLLALAHAKEAQARQLEARNIEIER